MRAGTHQLVGSEGNGASRAGAARTAVVTVCQANRAAADTTTGWRQDRRYAPAWALGGRDAVWRATGRGRRRRRRARPDAHAGVLPYEHGPNVRQRRRLAMSAGTARYAANRGLAIGKWRSEEKKRWLGYGKQHARGNADQPRPGRRWGDGAPAGRPVAPPSPRRVPGAQGKAVRACEGWGRRPCRAPRWGRVTEAWP